MYERQYKDKQLVLPATSLRTLRKLFEAYDVHREDLAISLLDSGQKLLDLGCGSGTFMVKAKDIYEEVYGIDISPFRVGEAKKSINLSRQDDDRFHFLCGNLNDSVSYPDEMFDSVVCISVIEHIFDPYHLVEESHRMLKPGGSLIVQVPNIAYIRQRLALLLGKLPVTSSPHNWKEIGWDGGHLHYFTERAFCNLLEDCGFSISKVRGSGLFAGIRSCYPALLTGDICVKARKH